MDVCVGVCILCNYASSSNSNDAPAGIVCLVTSALLTTVLAETEQHCVEQFLSKTLWEHQRCRQAAWRETRIAVTVTTSNHLQVYLYSQGNKENHYFQCRLLGHHIYCSPLTEGRFFSGMVDRHWWYCRISENNIYEHKESVSPQTQRGATLCFCCCSCAFMTLVGECISTCCSCGRKQFLSVHLGQRQMRWSSLVLA